MADSVGDNGKRNKRKEILDRLNSYNDELSEDDLRSEKDLECKRRYEREMELEWGRWAIRVSS
ncbi:hypothetical protein BH24ACT22_BH24ACT22_16800 [soil metagenome]